MRYCAGTVAPFTAGLLASGTTALLEVVTKAGATGKIKKLID